VFSKRFFEFFTTQSTLFCYTNLSFHYYIYPLGTICCESIFGDQSVKITKFSSLYLRRRICGFALCKVLEGAYCRGAILASYCACVCCSCANK